MTQFYASKPAFGRGLVYSILALLFLSFFVIQPAQAQSDESVYDPFIDYSEFEEAGEEEADINFFRNGRLLSAALAVGQRTFTGGMGDVFDDDVVYGLYFSYFFDLNFALQFSYTLGNHAYRISGPGGTVVGDAQTNSLGFDMKYFFNMQNVTKGLSGFNPYILVGFSSINRESKREGATEFAKESATGLDFGGGFEVPVLNNESFVGAQLMYQLVSFDNENTELKTGGIDTGITPDGDMISLTLILGKNF